MNRAEILSKINELKNSSDSLNESNLAVSKLLNNLYISVSSDGSLGIFLENIFDDPELPKLKNIKFNKKANWKVKSLDSEYVLKQCVRVDISNVSEPEITASIIELMFENTNGSYALTDLLIALEKFKILLKSSKSSLNDNELKGIWGELWFMKEIIFRCINREELERCLDSWKGSDTAKRDFRMPNKGLVFEIKTTEKKSRVHTISSADQLTKRENEEGAYLVSIGVKREEGGASHSISSLSKLIEEKLEDSLLVDKFFNLLRERKWIKDTGNDISLVLSVGIPMHFFPFDIVPTILPLPEHITDATWVVNLNNDDAVSRMERDRIFELAIKHNMNEN